MNVPPLDGIKDPGFGLNMPPNHPLDEPPDRLSLDVEPADLPTKNRSGPNERFFGYPDLPLAARCPQSVRFNEAAKVVEFINIEDKF